MNIYHTEPRFDCEKFAPCGRISLHKCRSTKADWMNAGDVRLYTVKPRRLPVRKPEERFVRIADVPFRSTGFITGLSDVGIRNTDVSPPGARCV